MKKGFTLVELLAVIAILAIVLIIAIPGVSNVSKNIKINMYCEKRDLVIVAAKNWGNDNLSTIKSNCYYRLRIEELVNTGYLKKEENNNLAKVVNPYNNQAMDSYYVYVYLKNSRAQAWYNETDVTLKDACNDKIPSDRPTSSCN